MTEPDDLGVHARFGRAIALRRVRAGLTQEQLGSAIGLARTSVANIEQGRQQVLLHNAVAIARALGVGLDELVGADSSGPEEFKVQLPADLEDGLGDWARVVLGGGRR